MGCAKRYSSYLKANGANITCSLLLQSASVHQNTNSNDGLGHDDINALGAVLRQPLSLAKSQNVHLHAYIIYYEAGNFGVRRVAPREPWPQKGELLVW